MIKDVKSHIWVENSFDSHQNPCLSPLKRKFGDFISLQLTLGDFKSVGDGCLSLGKWVHTMKFGIWFCCCCCCYFCFFLFL